MALKIDVSEVVAALDSVEVAIRTHHTSARISSGKHEEFLYANLKMSWFNLSAPTQITSCITMNGDRYNSEVAMIIEHSICSSRVTEVAGVSPLILADVLSSNTPFLLTR